MAIPITPTNYYVQQGDGLVYLSWAQSPTTVSYLVQRSLDNVNFYSLATITGTPLYAQYLDSNLINSSATQINISSSNVFVIGQPYVITSLGTTTQSQWQAIGVPAGTAAVVGLVFIASVTGSGTGTGTVQNGVQVGQVYYYQVAAQNGSGTSAYTTSQGIIPCAPGKECLGNMRLYAQQRIDKVNNNFVTLPEWNKYIMESYKELYDIILQKYGDDYYEAEPYSFLTTGSVQLYPLPDGVSLMSLAIPNPDGVIPSGVAKAFYKLLGVEVALNPNDPNSWVSLRKFEFIQRNLWNYPNVYTFRGVTNLRYRLNGNSLYLVPQTQAGQTVRIWYAGRPNTLIQDTDTIDGVSGWEEYIIVDACIKFLAKEESDPTIFMDQKAKLLARIESVAENRDVGEPETVSDSKMRNLAWTDDSGYGPGSGMFT